MFRKLAAVVLVLLVLWPSGAMAQLPRAVFAAGQFWHVQAAFDEVKGVVYTRVGYAGGRKDNPGYMDVAAGKSGHYEVVQVVYDPAVISYDKLLHIFWRMIDPTDGGGQFCHRGSQYRPAIFVSSEAQKKKVDEYMELLEADSERFDGRMLVVPVLELKKFYVAQDSHQRYYRKNALRYGLIEQRCGRVQRLRAVWGR